MPRSRRPKPNPDLLRPPHPHGCGGSVLLRPLVWFLSALDRQTGFDEFVRCRKRLRIQRRLTRKPAAFSRRGDAVAGTLGEQPSLEVRNGAEDMEHELADGR